DYKVVTAVCNGDITLVHMLSLKSNIWKLFGQINYQSFPEPAKEEFREIPQPDDSRYVWNYYYSLGIIEGSLCIFVKLRYPINNHQCNIWVMKNHNRKPSWERLPITNYCEMKDHAIHYMLKDSNQYRKTPPPTYYCDDNTQLSTSAEYIRSPIFVQTLVSPYVKEKRETEEEERGLVTNTYKNGSKGKERLLKSFWKKKERVE
ncbi:hypothetical protein Tco_1471679, partial [Tanacetum coccineum]